jgi:hypothetical protein
LKQRNEWSRKGDDSDGERLQSVQSRQSSRLRQQQKRQKNDGSQLSASQQQGSRQTVDSDSTQQQPAANIERARVGVEAQSKRADNRGNGGMRHKQNVMKSQHANQRDSHGNQGQTIAADARLIGSSQGNSRARSEEHGSSKGRAGK